MARRNPLACLTCSGKFFAGVCFLGEQGVALSFPRVIFSFLDFLPRPRRVSLARRLGAVDLVP